MMKIKKEKILNALFNAVKETFEIMAFLDIEKIKKKKLNQFTNLVAIDIIEPEPGCVILFLPLELKTKIVGNIFNVDIKDLEIKKVDDCLLEILNVIAGNFLKNTYKKTVKYRLDIPKMLFDKKEMEYNNKFLEIYCNAEDLPFKIGIKLK